ncbi:MAG: hypothetical protein WCS77_05260 [Elusimicrobiaceae bacterium]
MIEIILIVVWLSSIAFTAGLAQRKNRAVSLWAGLAFFLPVVTAIAISCLPKLGQKERICSSCRKWLPAEDKKCPHCQADLPEVSAPVDYRDMRESPVWLIILLALVAITAVNFVLLAVSGVRTYRQLKGKLAETSTQASLGRLRAASILYLNKTGRFPKTLNDLVPEYISAIPVAVTAAHPDCDQVEIMTSSAQSKDTGCWGYVSNPYSAENGRVFLDCSHVDSTGNIWINY